MTLNFGMFQIPSIKWNKVSLSKVTVSSILKNQLFKLQFQTFLKVWRWRNRSSFVNHHQGQTSKWKTGDGNDSFDLIFGSKTGTNAMGQKYTVISWKMSAQSTETGRTWKWDHLSFDTWHLSFSPPRGHSEVIQRSFIRLFSHFYLETTNFLWTLSSFLMK